MEELCHPHRGLTINIERGSNSVGRMITKPSQKHAKEQDSLAKQTYKWGVEVKTHHSRRLPHDKDKDTEKK